MRTKCLLVISALMAASPERLLAQSLWDNRDPNSAYLFHDLRARNVGDVLTIVIEETTGADAQEKREMDKKTKATGAATAKGSSSLLGNVLRSFAGDIDFDTSSQRTFDGKANSSINRNFNDRLTVVVVAVLPNGNIVVEGYRQRMITRELRTLRIMGIVRPADIGPYNTVQSQYIANLHIGYSGRGPESSYTNQGWGGRIVNKLWPN
jgi:flagellar L-ring protein precursor FlgH